jgi:type I restriction-modification system specificity subunit
MEYKLRDLYKVSNGLSKGGSFFGSGFPFISFSTVFNNFFIPEEINDFVQSTLKEQATYSIKKGDILITRTSETIDELGMSCVALKDYPTATFNGFCKRLRPLTDKVYPHFIGYYLRTPYFRANFTKVASLITRASLRNEDLLRFSIELPPIYKQKKIAEILYSYDNLIEDNNKRIKLLEQMAENLYKEWFVRFRFPGYEDVEFENGIPNGWAVEKVKKCVNRLPFNQLYKQNDLENEGSVIVIDQSSTDFLGFHNNEPSHYASIEKPIILFGDHSCKFVLMVRDFSLGENVVPFISFDDNFLDNYYLYYAVHKLIATEEYKRHWGRFTAMKIFIPQYHLQKTFSDIVKPMLEEKQKLWNENQLLIKQRDMLLPRLMSGKLEV